MVCHAAGPASVSMHVLGKYQDMSHTQAGRRRCSSPALPDPAPPTIRFLSPLFPPSPSSIPDYVNNHYLGFPKHLLPRDPDTQRGHRLPLWQPDTLSSAPAPRLD